MNKDEIISEIKNILSKEFGFLTEDDSKIEQYSLVGSEIAFSSMDYVKFIVLIEDKYKVVWPDEWLALDDISIGSIADFIGDLINASEEN